MAALVPRPPYTPEELRQLYPPQLQLEQVQIILRHGERTPVSARFQNAGLPAYWPYCQHAKRFKDIVMAQRTPGTSATDWDTITFNRVLETFDENGLPVASKGPKGEMEGICQPGELTTQGRLTTLALGQRLRTLYIDQLHFLPASLDSPTTITLRSTPIQRALESVQQAYTGLYPSTTRSQSLPAPTIIARAIGEETLFPNTGACKRFNELFWAYADRAAKEWNNSKEMKHINSKVGKYWPPMTGVAVDSKPRLNGLMDTVNATRAHGPATKLPDEFYDEKLLEYVDKISCEEWYKGYQESREFRRLGSGALAADLAARMQWHVERAAKGAGPPGSERDETRADMKMLLAGAHDTTLAGLLTSLGAYNENSWPPFTSHVAVELFSAPEGASATAQSAAASSPASAKSWWSSIPFLSSLTPSSSASTAIAATPTASLSPSDSQLLRRHYVRIRYNSVPALIPGCAKPGRHLEGDPSFCTLEAFRAIVEDITPRDWKKECKLNLGEKMIPDKVQPAGYCAGDEEAVSRVREASSRAGGREGWERGLGLA